ncbi:hypothetical protein Smp_018230 [Schistosoma mansoni]|uniref:hypothetical protein n=1 Tax=Schistosoma mansoni TaxID=6183 RepID=UPI0001A63B85|nr:hypothetical protein Smp_018230 [Schistosoma mansoni]|eukprot:XP_018647060.1 hypothetical protein Smp_018230 [Schistosoma mansoni]
MRSDRPSSASLTLDKALLVEKQMEKRPKLEKRLRILKLQDGVELTELECNVREEDNQLPIDNRGVNTKMKRCLNGNTGFSGCSGEPLNTPKNK